MTALTKRLRAQRFGACSCTWFPYIASNSSICLVFSSSGRLPIVLVAIEEEVSYCAVVRFQGLLSHSLDFKACVVTLREVLYEFGHHDYCF